MKKKEQIALLKAEVERLKTNVANANRTFDSKLFEKYRGIEQFGHQLMLANEAIDSKIEEFVNLHSKLMELQAKEMNENENLFEEKLPEKRNEFCDCNDSHSFTSEVGLTEKQSDLEFILTHMPKYRFTYDQCELVLNTFGRDGFIEALNICQSLNISPDALCTDKLHGKKSICLTCAKKDDCIYLKAVKHAYISDCAQYASENFTVLKDSDGKEFGVLTEVFDDLIKDGKVISK